jgi:indole-3-glycerol phosphate synthase
MTPNGIFPGANVGTIPAKAMNILERIVEVKRRELARMPVKRVDVACLRAALEARDSVQRDFTKALRRPRAGSVALIAEVKKASPSAGLIRPDFDPVAIALAYERAGASCLSVLTDEEFFQGSLRFLREIREAVTLPLLRKDFVLDPRQVLEAVEWGADAVLLIAAILPDDELRSLHELVLAAGLTALVEVHDEVEMDRVLRIGARVVGVNNRDLRTFRVDLGTTERLAERLHAVGPGGDVFLVAESGIQTRADVERLERCGAGAILVGETLMREKDVVKKAAELLGA